jgi:hypothetical protein
MPYLRAIFFAHPALVNVYMATKAKCSNELITGFNAPSLAVYALVRVSGYHRTILCPAMLTR